MEIYDDKFKKIHGYEEGKSDALDPESMGKALGYKKTFLKNFISINQFQIDSRLAGDKYYVTKKYDGEYAIIMYEDGQAVTVNRSGRTRRGIPCIEEARKLIQKAGIKQAVIPAEIYVEDADRKTRVNDLISALAHKERISTLRLAVFDIVEIDHKPIKGTNFQKVWDLMNDIFGNGKLCRPVEMEIARSSAQVKDMFYKWVEQEGAEGLVVHTELPFTFKIKPRHNIDVVVVGYSEGTGVEQGQVRSLLTALIPSEGRYQVMGRVGSGLREELRKELFRRFSKKKLRSEYIETDSNYVAFQMVEPELVIEISINDLLFDTRNGQKQNPILYVEGGEYKLEATVDGFKFLAPVFERVRDDKKADAFDVRPSQIESFSYREPSATVATPSAVLRESEMLTRAVFKKETGGKLMIQKYIVWKTNKEQSGDYPAFVFHYTNFSTDRMEPLQREVKISEDFDQILELQENSMRTNIKKGWSLVKGSEYIAESISVPERIFESINH